jgi:Flp pilus assembly CpaF family ATPase
LHIRKPHLVSAQSQTDTHRSQITFDDLLKAVLRHRPDCIIVGEVRGPEARTLLDAMNTGHRLLTGKQATMLRQIVLQENRLPQVLRVIEWIRQNYALLAWRA